MVLAKVGYQTSKIVSQFGRRKRASNELCETSQILLSHQARRYRSKLYIARIHYYQTLTENESLTNPRTQIFFTREPPSLDAMRNPSCPFPASELPSLQRLSPSGLLLLRVPRLLPLRDRPLRAEQSEGRTMCACDRLSSRRRGR